MPSFEKLTDGLKSIETALGNVSKTADEASTSVAGATKSIRENVEQTEKKSRGAFDKMKSFWEDGRKEFQRRLDQIGRAFEEGENAWSDAILRSIALVKAGLLSAEEFRKSWGETQIEVAGELVKINDLLSEMQINTDSARQEIQKLVSDLRRGNADITQVIGFLRSQGNAVSDTISGWVEAFKRGERSLEEFINFLNFIKEQSPGSDLEPLLDYLTGAAQSAGLKGGGF